MTVTRRPWAAVGGAGRIQRLLYALFFAGCLPAMRCTEDPPLFGHGHGKPGETVDIDGQKVESGFALGQMRKTADVAGFRISKFPVTIGEYKACVSGGGCERPPDGACTDAPDRLVTQRPNYDREGVPEDSAVTCVGLRGAGQYCTWLGGKLPTLEQWFLAARGSSVQRHPWGGSAAICKQHAVALEGDDGQPCQWKATDLARIGQHPAGASPSGVQDVLLTSG